MKEHLLCLVIRPSGRHVACSLHFASRDLRRTSKLLLILLFLQIPTHIKTRRFMMLSVWDSIKDSQPVILKCSKRKWSWGRKRLITTKQQHWALRVLLQSYTQRMLLNIKLATQSVQAVLLIFSSDPLLTAVQCTGMSYQVLQWWVLNPVK